MLHVGTTRLLAAIQQWRFAGWCTDAAWTGGARGHERSSSLIGLTSLEGRAGWHSESEHVPELVLKDVTIYRYEDSARLYSVPTVYLSREIGKLVIEVVPWELLQEDGQ
jgi:hypothetical protein